ncbi:MAG: putative Ig domain-containing protein, partial [Pseudomonadota bacterium]|nr:putative Ig domain-containing protein [Pseudomonadota bacterium]
MIIFRTALLLSFVAGLTACSSGGSDGDEPRIPDPVDGGGQAPVALDFSSTPEGNPVEEERWQYQIETNLADSDFLTFSLVSGPASMTISEEGLVQWTPDDEDGTQVQATVRAIYNDGTNTATAEQTFELTVTPVNDKPEITSVAPTSAVIGSWVNYKVEVSDPDDENNGTDLTFSASLPLVNSSRDLFQLTISDTGLARFYIPEAYAQNYSSVLATVTVADGGEDGRNPATQSIFLMLVEGNVAPDITSSPATSATEDVQYTYQVEAYDPVFADRGATKSEDDLSYTLTTAPQGMTISATGLIEWTPTEQGAEPYLENVTVVVADGGEDGVEPATQSFAIDVTPVNDAPVLTGSPISFVEVGTTYSYQLVVFDTDDINIETDLTFS